MWEKHFTIQGLSAILEFTSTLDSANTCHHITDLALKHISFENIWIIFYIDRDFVTFLIPIFNSFSGKRIHCQDCWIFISIYLNSTKSIQKMRIMSNTSTYSTTLMLTRLNKVLSEFLLYSCDVVVPWDPLQSNPNRCHSFSNIQTCNIRSHLSLSHRMQYNLHASQVTGCQVHLT